MYRRSGAIENIHQILASWFPSMIDRIVLNGSREGREISALRIHAGDNEDRNGMLFIGGTHARELLNPDLLINMVIDLLSHYFSGTDWVMGGRTWDADVLRIVMETLDIFVLSNANPDGRERVLDGDRMWRKNRAPLSGTNCVGVDLNRNFDLLWGIRTRTPSGVIVTSTDPCHDTYVGPNAFSEAETQNVKTLLDNHRIDCLVDVHSYSELILHPWGHAPNQTADPNQRFTEVDTSSWNELPTDAPNYKEYIPPADLEKFQKIGAAAAEAIKDVRGRTYLVQAGTDLYPTTGTTSDYAYSRHVAITELRKVYGFTFETGPWTGDALESFQPESPQRENIAEEATSGLLSVLHSCVCAIHLIGADLFGDDEQTLDALRAFRDEELADTASGRAWIGMLERHQAELTHLSLRDQAFKNVAGELIALAGSLSEDDLFDRRRATEIRDLLRRLEQSEISKELRADLRRLHLLTREVEGRSVREATEHLGRLHPKGRSSRGRHQD